MEKQTPKKCSGFKLKFFFFGEDATSFLGKKLAVSGLLFFACFFFVVEEKDE